jgi:hypothetical protein
MQLVLSNNRIIAHGENFLAMGGVVINTETGARYENATIAECNGCPSDIDKVGYEYHAGVFVPCAPYGVGEGNVGVYCDDCKTPRDSGFHSQYLRKMFHTTYTGTGSTTCGVECGFPPKFAIITGKTRTSGQSYYMGLLSASGGAVYKDGEFYAKLLSVTVTETGLSWTGSTEINALNYKAGANIVPYDYDVLIIG